MTRQRGPQRSRGGHGRPRRKVGRRRKFRRCTRRPRGAVRGERPGRRWESGDKAREGEEEDGEDESGIEKHFL